MDDLAEYPFELFTKVKKHTSGRIQYAVAYLTKELQKQLPLDKHPRLRIDGEVCGHRFNGCLLYTSPSPRDLSTSRMPSSA